MNDDIRDLNDNSFEQIECRVDHRVISTAQGPRHRSVVPEYINMDRFLLSFCFYFSVV